MLQNGQMTDFGENLDQLEVKLSRELNVIETNRYFLQKKKVNKIELGIKKGPNGIWKCQKRGSIERKFPTMFKYGSAPMIDNFQVNGQWSMGCGTAVDFAEYKI